MLEYLRELRNRPAALAGSLVLVLFLVMGIGTWLLHASDAAGWAKGDAVIYHFPVINYFISNGIDWGYPRGIAMLPGMHAYFALVAQLFGLSSLSADDPASFLIQTPFAIAYASVLALALRRAGSVEGTPGPALWLLVPILLSSGYVLESWIWPTTDIAAFFVFVGLIVVLQGGVARGNFNLTDALAYSALILLGTAFRQSFAPLAAGLGAMLLMTQSRATWIRPGSLLCMALPLAAAGLVVLICLWGWGGLLPPDLQRHGTTSLNFVAGWHVVALTGLIAWPFALSGARIVSDRADWWRAREVWIIVLATAVIAAVATLIVPMTPDEDAGRRFSLVWSLQTMGPLAPLRLVLVFGMLWAGAFVWATVLIAMWRRRQLAPEVLIMGLYTASLLVQAYSWQRYAEAPILITLGLFFARRFKPGLIEALAIVGWGSAYLLLTLAKALT